MNWDQIGQIWTQIKDGVASQWDMLINENGGPVELIPARVARGEGRYARAFRSPYLSGRPRFFSSARH